MGKEYPLGNSIEEHRVLQRERLPRPVVPTELGDGPVSSSGIQTPLDNHEVIGPDGRWQSLGDSGEKRKGTPGKRAGTHASCESEDR